MSNYTSIKKIEKGFTITVFSQKCFKGNRERFLSFFPLATGKIHLKKKIILTIE